jgi:3-hydroxymyristoyl/3-hydroxydecanoyl-(acyl carrier protein) dehydratase
MIAPGAVSEAVGQLASWLCLERNGFAGRPVFLFADRIEMGAPVRPGTTVELSAELAAMDAESLRFSGEAKVGGETVLKVMDCSGYFMPLAELEDPAVTKARFAAITGGGLILPDGEGAPYPFAALAGDTVSSTPGTAIRTCTTMAAGEPFYGDHFPRFPVTPIVMLNEMIGASTARMLGLPGAGLLRVRATRDVKIRSFVRPGDVLETVVQVTGSSREHGVQRIEATAEILKAGRRILRGHYHYDVSGEP